MKRMKMTTTTLRYDIPLDLIIQILLRLPAKSVLRFRCVSKSWCSIISGQQFIEAFMSRPPPGLVFVLKKGNDEDRVFFFSSPQHQSCSLSSSMLLAEKNTLRIPKFKSNHNFIFNSVRGFVCCFLRDRFLVCNPSTGQVIPLSESHNDLYSSSAMYLGYDPNNNQYKVLRLRYGHSPPLIEHSVCTLGGGQAERSWRPIKASIPHHYCFRNGVCIDGVVYFAYTKMYLTYTDDPEIILSSFDVESEQLRLIAKPEGCLSLSGGKLTNYLGKLAVYRPLGDVTNVFTLWVLDDVKNQVWSQKTRVFPSLTDDQYLSFRFQGITTSGEIVYVPCLWVSDSFEILCYDVEKSTGRRVTVEGHAGCIKAAVNCSSSTTDIYSLGFTPSLLCSYVDNVICL